MDGDRNRTGHDRGIRNLAIASICLPFLVFPLGPVAIVLNEIIGPSTSLLGLLTVLGIVLPAAGASVFGFNADLGPNPWFSICHRKVIPDLSTGLIFNRHPVPEQ